MEITTDTVAAGDDIHGTIKTLPFEESSTTWEFYSATMKIISCERALRSVNDHSQSLKITLFEWKFE